MDKSDFSLITVAGVTSGLSAMTSPVVAKWSCVVAGSAIGAILAMDLSKRLELVEFATSMWARLRVHFLMGLLVGGWASDTTIHWFPEPDHERSGVIMLTAGAVSIFSVTGLCLLWPMFKTAALQLPIFSWMQKKPPVTTPNDSTPKP